MVNIPPLFTSSIGKGESDEDIPDSSRERERWNNKKRKTPEKEQTEAT
jgi:hypothetical protein